MSTVVGWISDLFLLVGSFLCITGGLGLLRMPDFFTRVHTTGVIDTLAAPMLLLGLLLQMEWCLESVKVILIMAFILVTSPTATHAMAKAALNGGQRPLVTDKDEGEESSNP